MLSEPAQKRNLDLLKSDFRVKINNIIAALTREGLRPFVIETLRSEARQKWLVMKGRSWVKHSNHQDGIACDIGFLDLRGRCIWDSSFRGWSRLAHYARANGCVSGHDWKKLDCPHVEES